MKTRITAALAFLLFVIAVLSACSTTDTPAPSLEETRVLRIGTLGDADYGEKLTRRYVDSFVFARNGAVEVELIVADSMDGAVLAEDSGAERSERQYNNLRALLEGDNPVDVVLVETSGTEVLRKLVRDNALKPLTPFITDHQFDLADYSPAPLSVIKQIGNREIYALAPYFSTSALQYNKTLLQEQGLPLPYDGITWSEVFDLARQVSSGEGSERIYGYGDDEWGLDYFRKIADYAKQRGLRVYNQDATVMTVNTPEWAQAVTDIIDLYRENIWVSDSAAGTGLWKDGRLAMKEITYNDVQPPYDRELPFEWDIVTLPVHPATPNNGATLSLTGLVGMSTKAVNTRDAWDYIAFINGAEWARVKGNGTQGDLVARLSGQMATNPTIDLDAFNTPNATPFASNEELSFAHPGIYTAEYSIPNLLLPLLKNGAMTVPEALTEWEMRGNEVLGLSAAAADEWWTTYAAQRTTPSP